MGVAMVRLKFFASNLKASNWFFFFFFAVVVIVQDDPP